MPEINAKTSYSWESRAHLLELDFGEQEYFDRARRLSARLSDAGLDALVIYEPAASASNSRYLTGFATASTWLGGVLTLVRADGEMVLVTSSIAHGEPMHSNIQTARLRDVRALQDSSATGFAEAAAAVLAGWRACRVGVHRQNEIPFGLHRALSGLDGVAFVDAGDLVSALRRIKSPAEIEILRRLGRITAQGMAAAVEAVAEGVSESAIAAAAHQACVAAGAELMVFGCYVATGPRSALKNVVPRPRNLVKPGEVTMIDLGCKLHGYQSDMSRNVVVGEPDRQLADMLDACDQALQAGKDATRPGVRDVDVVAAVRDAIIGRGFAADDYTICHSYGLDLVEEPNFDPRHPQTLEAGMGFYIEPMIIPPTIGSICIEDMVLVTDSGCETLTELPTRYWR